MPFEYIPAGSFASPEEVVGRVPRERILANEFIRKERLADRSAGIGLNALISRGMRAVSINITNGSALSGFLNPGNYVDVLVTINPQVEGAGDDQTFTLLQAVYVLAVRARMVQDNMRSGAGEVRGRGSAPSVTLQVTPEQAEQLAHARQKGTITLLLRNDLDLQFTETQGATVKSLLGVDDKPKVKARRAPAPKPKQTLLIYKGTRSKEYTYDTPPSR